MDTKYFKIHQPAENIYHIEESAGVFTSLIVGEERALLIDTGYGFCDLHKIIRELTDLPVTIVNTHGHLDHAGGDYLFDEVYINYKDLPVYLWYQAVEKPKFLEKFEKDYGDRIHDIWPEDFDAEAYMGKKARHLIPLEDHERFDLGGRSVEAIFLPGHTKGSVVFLDDQSGLLFSGDDISKTVWIQFDHSASLEEYKNGLDQLRNYPIKGIITSHLPDIFPKHLIDWVMLAIMHATPEKSRLFVHPRTGQKALFYREKVSGIDNVHSIRLVYPGQLP